MRGPFCGLLGDIPDWQLDGELKLHRRGVEVVVAVGGRRGKRVVEEEVEEELASLPAVFCASLYQVRGLL